MNTRKTGLLLFAVSFLALGVYMVSCSSSGSGGSAGQTEAGVLIGPEGGTVMASEQESGIPGAKVYIPAGALSEGKSITLKTVPLPMALPSGYLAAGPCISFNPDGTTFSQPASIYLPYADVNGDGLVDGKAVKESKVAIFYYNSKTGQWNTMELAGSDGAGNLVMARTEHFSTYLAVINTGDSEPLDPGTSTTAAFRSGDCLVGTGNLDPADPDNRDSCFYYNLTVTRRSSGLMAIVDRFATYVPTGIPATISPEGDSATFDAASAFTKVRQSGDATLWNWECEFVKEYTFLKDYDAVQDVLTVNGSTDTTSGIYAQVEAVDENMVKISWQVDANEQILYQSSSLGSGHCIVIRFRASYR